MSNRIFVYFLISYLAFLRNLNDEMDFEKLLKKFYIERQVVSLALAMNSN